MRVAWFTGGHDGGAGPQSDQDRVKFLTVQWLDHYLKGEGDAPGDGFTYSRIAGFDALDRGLVATGFRRADYPGLAGSGAPRGRRSPARRSRSPTRPTATRPRSPRCPAPGGGSPSLLDGVAGDMPGQHADFDSAPLTEAVDVVGAPTVADPGRVADRRGGALRQALRRRPGRRGRPCRTGWSRRSG